MVGDRSISLLLLLSITVLTIACGDATDSGRPDPVEIDLTSGESQDPAASDSPVVDDQPPMMMESDVEDDPGRGELTGAGEIDPMTPPDAPVPEEEGALVFMPLAADGDVVSFVEIERYMGRWYEFATTPSFQQASCFDTQAEYVFNEAQGWVDVVNRCAVRNGNGRQQEVQGRAELVDTETQAKLAVSFFGQRAPYWVVALDGADGDAPYQWAVVSGPGSQFMWILSRTTVMGAAEKAQLYRYLTERGFPVDQLIETTHTIAED